MRNCGLYIRYMSGKKVLCIRQDKLATHLDNAECAKQNKLIKI